MKFSIAALGLLASVAAAAPLEERAELVQSNKLRRVLLRSNLLAKAKTLEGFAYASPDRNRLIDTPGHQSTIDWLVKTTSDLNYYNVTTQEFQVQSGTVVLTVGGKEYEGRLMTFSPDGHPVAPVVAVANIGCDAADYPDLTGKIALISRGTCSFASKSINAAAKGAVGALIYNNVEGPLDGTLGEPEGAYAPTVGLSQADGQAILASLSSPVTADLEITYFEQTTYNVIAQSLSGDQDNVIHLGAHSDSVAAGPGINDNGSGSIALLEVATQLSKFAINNAVRFSWWSAEEEGLLGATAYVASLSQEELDKIRLYLNFDMIASPNFKYGIYDGDGSAFNVSGAPGSAEAEKLFQDFFTKEEGLPWTSSEFDGRSDYGPFLDVGIPCGGLDTGAEKLKTVEEAAIFGGQAGIAYDPNYHSAGDNVKNLNVGALLHNTKAIAHATATFARSFDLLPPKSKRIVKKSVSGKKYVGPIALY